MHEKSAIMCLKDCRDPPTMEISVAANKQGTGPSGLSPLLQQFPALISLLRLGMQILQSAKNTQNVLLVRSPRPSLLSNRRGDTWLRPQ
jgi:hypothetical protein